MKESEPGGETRPAPPEHSCMEHKVARSSGIDPRLPGRTWVNEYECGICGAFLGRGTERHD